MDIKHLFKEHNLNCFYINSYKKIIHSEIGYIRTSAHLYPKGTAFSKLSLNQIKQALDKNKKLVVNKLDDNEYEFSFE